jgi:sRNA-binding regulator protein Hfq
MSSQSDQSGSSGRLPSQRQYAKTGLTVRGLRKVPALDTFRLTSHQLEETSQRQAELFYLQKQIQAQTPMVIVMDDGERIEGRIEWYDRQSIKIVGRAKKLVYKSAIKYMYKEGDVGAN